MKGRAFVSELGVKVPVLFVVLDFEPRFRQFLAQLFVNLVEFGMVKGGQSVLLWRRTNLVQHNHLAVPIVVLDSEVVLAALIVLDLGTLLNVLESLLDQVLMQLTKLGFMSHISMTTRMAAMRSQTDLVKVIVQFVFH